MLSNIQYCSLQVACQQASGNSLKCGLPIKFTQVQSRVLQIQQLCIMLQQVTV